MHFQIVIYNRIISLMAILKLIFVWEMNPLLANTEVFDARIEALAEQFGVRFRAGSVRSTRHWSNTRRPI